MKRFLLRVSTLLALSLTSALSLDAVAIKGMTKITSKQHHDEILAKGKPVVIMFTADWCGACKIAAPDFENELIAAYPGIIFTFVDADVEATKSLKSQYGIQALPTFIFIDSKGNKVNSVRGYPGKDVINGHLGSLNGGRATIAPMKEKMHEEPMREEKPMQKKSPSKKMSKGEMTEQAPKTMKRSTAKPARVRGQMSSREVNGRKGKMEYVDAQSIPAEHRGSCPIYVP
jgi:thioredoxin 1